MVKTPSLCSDFFLNKSIVIHPIKKLLKIRWWEFDEDQLKDVEHYFFDVNKFVSKYDNNE